MSAVQKGRVSSKARNLELLTSSQFIRQLIEEGKLQFDEQDMVTVTYHDSCISSRVLGVIKEPREVIDRIPGVYRVEMVPSEKETRCCGSHAFVNMVDPHLASQIAEMRIRDASVTPATKLVSECPRCLLAFDFATMTLGYSMDTVDIAQLTARSLKTSKEESDS
jgi:Fe-S oxidoreductase